MKKLTVITLILLISLPSAVASSCMDIRKAESQCDYILDTRGTGSMSPVLEGGYKFCCQREPYNTIQIGDIAVYNSGGVSIVHRVVYKDQFGYVMKGDTVWISDTEYMTRQNYVCKLDYIFQGNYEYCTLREYWNK